jgi:hypothetical protein
VALLSALQSPISSRYHCRPSPCGRLSRPPRQVATPATTTAAPPHPKPVSRRCAQPKATSLAATARADPRWFPCSLVDRSTEEAPDSTPATSPWLPRSTSPRPPLSPADMSGSSPASVMSETRVRVASGPDPPGSSRCVFERRITSVSRVCLSATLATPASSGSTDAPWLCRGRLPPIPAPPGTGCPQLHRPAATGRRRRSLTSTQPGSTDW